MATQLAPGIEIPEEAVDVLQEIEAIAERYDGITIERDARGTWTVTTYTPMTGRREISWPTLADAVWLFREREVEPWTAR